MPSHNIYHLSQEQWDAFNKSMSDIMDIEYNPLEKPSDDNFIIVPHSIPWNKGKEMNQDYKDAHKGYIFTPEQYSKVINHLNNLRKKLYSEERNKKISESLKGKTFSEQRKQNISNSLIGKKLSEVHKKKISNSLIGKPSRNLGNKHSEETKKKMSDAKKGRTPWNKGVSGYKRNKKSSA